MFTGLCLFSGVLLLVLLTQSFSHEFDYLTMISCQLTPDVTVAGDGSGDYVTITEALAGVPKKRTSRVVLYIKAGVYSENVIVSRDNITIYGDGKGKSIVSGNLSKIDHPEFTTYQTATFSVTGNQFLAKDMGFVNVAGPKKNQAVAFHARSRHSVRYRCAFMGFQDTLYAPEGEQLYRECDIVGTVDFIFGHAAAVFQMCNIRPRIPLAKQVVTITAQGRDKHTGKSGFSIINSRIFPWENFTAVAYLGRPWGSHVTVAFMETELGDFIHPSGWLAWNRSTDPPPPTVNLGEYQNYGPGSGVRNRVKWVGYNPVMSDKEAKTFSVDALINQDGWLKESCVPFNGSI